MRKNFLGSGLLTAGALLLVYAAFDDITTDNATAFPVEYSFLALCAAWLLVLGIRLVRAQRPMFGWISIAAVAAALWAQRALGPAMVAGWRTEYTVITAAYVWFWFVAAALIRWGWHPRTAT